MVFLGLGESSPGRVNDTELAVRGGHVITHDHEVRPAAPQFFADVQLSLKCLVRALAVVPQIPSVSAFRVRQGGAGEIVVCEWPENFQGALEGSSGSGRIAKLALNFGGPHGSHAGFPPYLRRPVL